MALFKILKGQEANLPDKKTEGWAYVTTDEGNMYVDVSDDKRVKIGSHSDTSDEATTAKGDTETIRDKYVSNLKEKTSSATEFSFLGIAGSGAEVEDLISIPLAGEVAGLISNGKQTLQGDKTFNGCVRIKPTSADARQGLRIGFADGNWSMITLGATAESGYEANSWHIADNAGAFFITHNGANSSTTGILQSTSQGNWQIDNSLGINGRNTAYKFYVNGDSYLDGDTDVKNIYPDDANAYNIGSLSKYFKSVYSQWINANANGSGADGGVTLYAESPSYAIMFRTTGSLGKMLNTTSSSYGISSDWATYFTMSDTPTRGWVFRRGSTNVAAVTGNGTFMSSVSTGSHIAGHQGKVIIDGTAAAGYNMLFRQKSTSGVFTGGAYNKEWQLYYASNENASTGNTYNYNITLLDESGRSYLRDGYFYNIYPRTNLTGDIGYYAAGANSAANNLIWLNVRTANVRNLAVDGGLYWDPYVETATDKSDAASITVKKTGVAGGSELRLQQANDSGDVINLVAPYYIYLNNKRAFQVNDTWLRINESSGFSAGVYFGSGTGGVVRTDNQFQVGDNGSNFYVNSSGNGYFSNSLGIAGTDTSYNLYVNGDSYLNGNLVIPNNKAFFGILGSCNSTVSSNVGGLTWFNINGTAGCAVDVNDTPTSAWWYVLRNRHTNTGNDYYTDIAIPFNNKSIYYKRVTSSSVSDKKWVKVLDEDNYHSTLDSQYMGIVSDGEYYGMSINTNTSLWVRTTTYGIIPHHAGNINAGNSSLGTAYWSFANSYVTNMYGYKLGLNGFDSNYNLYVNGTSSFNGNTVPNVNNTHSLGTSTLKWNSVYATTFIGALSGNATTATSISYTSFTKSLQLTTDWIDTGIAGTNLSNGTYIVQVYCDVHANGAKFWFERFSGIMSWFSGATNSTNNNEIVLHAAGLATNEQTIYLRVQRTANPNTLKLQVSSNVAWTAAGSIVFKFAKIING